MRIGVALQVRIEGRLTRVDHVFVPKRIVLARSTSGIIKAHFDCGDEPSPESQSFASTQLADFVREHEVHHPRWVWDDTTRWYPELLEAHVRVKRCADLRLNHNILRRSPFADQSLLVCEETEKWDALQPAGEERQSLFAAYEFDDTLDVLAEDRAQLAAVAGSTESKRLTLLLAAESSGALAAAEMTHTGLPWRADIHEQLLVEQLGARPMRGKRPEMMERLLQVIREAFNAPDLNPDSPAELLTALRGAGLDIENTRSWTLEREDHPGIPALLEYRQLSRLLTANGWHWLDTWIKQGRFRSQFLVGAVVTGRWASLGGGALQLPAQLRSAVVADDGWKFIVADVAQLEPRVLAGCSGDLAMAQAARATDLYQGMVDAGAVPSRNDAKLGLLAAMYGATQGESRKMVDRMFNLYPTAMGFVEGAARTGERGDVVHTLLGRGSPIPNAAWVGGTAEQEQSQERVDERERRAWGRFTRNFVIQGTGAEWALCWMAELRNRLFELHSNGVFRDTPHLAFFLHDEVVIHTPEHLANEVAESVRAAALQAGRLLFGNFPIDFPLDVAIVDCWADAG